MAFLTSWQRYRHPIEPANGRTVKINLGNVALTQYLVWRRPGRYCYFGDRRRPKAGYVTMPQVLDHGYCSLVHPLDQRKRDSGDDRYGDRTEQ